MVGRWFRADIDSDVKETAMNEVLVLSARGRYQLLTVKGPARAPRAVIPVQDGKWHLSAGNLELSRGVMPRTRSVVRVVEVDETALVLETDPGGILTFDRFLLGEFPLIDRVIEGRQD